MGTRPGRTIQRPSHVRRLYVRHCLVLRRCAKAGRDPSSRWVDAHPNGPQQRIPGRWRDKENECSRANQQRNSCATQGQLRAGCVGSCAEPLAQAPTAERGGENQQHDGNDDGAHGALDRCGRTIVRQRVSGLGNHLTTAPAPRHVLALFLSGMDCCVGIAIEVAVSRLRISQIPEHREHPRAERHQQRHALLLARRQAHVQGGQFGELARQLFELARQDARGGFR